MVFNFMTSIAYSNILNQEQIAVVGQTMKLSKDPNFTGHILNLPMGFGKTRTIVAVGLNLYRRILVICSKTLITSWINELDSVFKFKKDVDYEILHKDYMGSTDAWTIRHSTRIVITTPEVVLASFKNNEISRQYVVKNEQINHYIKPSKPYGKLSYGLENLHRINWEGIVVDEFHNYTNFASQKCQAISSLVCNHRWLLSGTPLPEPKIDRLFGVFLLLNQKTPNNLPQCAKFVTSLEFKGLNAYSICVAQPVVLPCKLNQHYVIYTLGKQEKSSYRMFKLIINKWSKFYTDQKALLGGNNSDVRKIRGNLVTLMTYLRQLLVDPSIGVNNLIDKIKTQPELQPLYKTTKKMIKYIDIKSTRFLKVAEILQSHKQQKILVFGCYADCLKSCLKYYQQEYSDIPLFRLDGIMSATQRADTLDKFRTSETGVLFLTYQLGSEGLNLQEASVVIHLDLYWNRHKEDQAVSRCYRLGQKAEHVDQYYIISNTSFERALLDRHRTKLQMIDDVTNGPISKGKIKAIKFIDMLNMLDLEDIDQAIVDRSSV